MNLDEFLEGQDYQSIKLRATDFGHLEIPATINGIEVLLLIDTGAASTVIDIAFAQEHGIELIDTAIRGGGVGTSDLVIHEVKEALVRLNGFEFPPLTIFAADLSHVKQSLADKGETRLPSGVVGADILRNYDALIDYPNLALYLKNNHELTSESY
jgi:hypothetical protein